MGVGWGSTGQGWRDAKDARLSLPGVGSSAVLDGEGAEAKEPWWYLEAGNGYMEKSKRGVCAGIVEDDGLRRCERGKAAAKRGCERPGLGGRAEDG